jgi:hypothetical protein
VFLEKEEDTSTVTERQDAVGIYVSSLESITREEDGNYYRRLFCVYIHVCAINLPRVIYTLGI